MPLDRTLLGEAGLLRWPDALHRADGYGLWLVPGSVWVDGDRLVWGGPGRPIGESREGLLEGFVRLHDGPDEAIAKYAAKWGVLEICAEHRLPSSHFPDRYYRWLSEDQRLCRPATRLDGRRSEPLSTWRDFSLMGATVLEIAARLKGTKASGVGADIWSVLGPLQPDLIPGVVGGDVVEGIERPLAALGEQRRLLGMVVQAWLTLGDVRTLYRWDDNPHFDLGGGHLFGVLGIQLALAVAGTQGLALCDECGRVFIPRRQGKPGAPRRCPDRACRDLAAKRESARRRRARERGEPG